MSGYTEVIFQALVLFPLAALLITMPFLIHHYRKFGSITFPRVFLVYSFVLYLMCAYFLVILPLPDKGEADFPYNTAFALQLFSGAFPGNRLFADGPFYMVSGAYQQFYAAICV